MADEPIGKIPIEITGDYSQLQSDLDAAANVAEQSGQKIASALEQAANSGTGFDALTNAAVAAGEQFSLFGGEIEALASQMTLFDTNSITASESMQQIGDAAGTATPPINEAADAVKHAGESAHEAAEGGFAELSEQIVQFGEALAITEGLKEFGTEALDVFGTVQKVTVSMTALTGSAEATREVIEQVKQLAATQPFSFPELAPTAQKLAAFQVSAEEIPKILQSMGDAAAATGSAFDGVANRFDRIAFSGAASSKSLVGLGLTVSDLAKQMGVADSEVKNAFKDLDQQERIDVLIEALKKFQGQSQLMADTIPGHWQLIKNKFEEVMEGMGAELAPFAQKAMDVLGGQVVPAVQNAVNWFGQLPEPVKDSAVAIGHLAASVVPVTLALGAFGIAASAAATGLATLAPAITFVGGLFPGVAASLVALGEAVAAAAAAWGGWKLGEWLYQNNPLLQQFGDYVADLLLKIPGLAGAVTYLSGAQGQLDAANRNLAASIEILKTKLAEHGIVVDRGTLSLQEYAAALRAAVAQAGPAADEEEGLSKAAQHLVDTQEKANSAVKEAKAVMQEMAAALKDGDVSNQAYLRSVKAYDDAVAHATVTIKEHLTGLAAILDATKKADSSFNDARDTYDATVAAFEKGNATLDDVKRALDAMSKAFTDAHPALKDAGTDFKDVSDAVGGAKDSFLECGDAFNKLTNDATGLFDSLPDGIVLMNKAGEVTLQVVDDMSNLSSGVIDVNTGIITLKGSLDSVSEAFGAADAVIVGFDGTLTTTADLAKQVADAMDAVAEAAGTAGDAIDEVSTKISGKGGGGGGQNSAMSAATALAGQELVRGLAAATPSFGSDGVTPAGSLTDSMRALNDELTKLSGAMGDLVQYTKDAANQQSVYYNELTKGSKALEGHTIATAASTQATTSLTASISDLNSGIDPVTGALVHFGNGLVSATNTLTSTVPVMKAYDTATGAAAQSIAGLSNTVDASSLGIVDSIKGWTDAVDQGKVSAQDAADAIGKLQLAALAAAQALGSTNAQVSGPSSGGDFSSAIKQFTQTQTSNAQVGGPSPAVDFAALLKQFTTTPTLNARVNADGTPYVTPGSTPTLSPLAIPITVNAGVVAGSNGMQQLADMVQQQVIQNMKRAGYKF